MALRRLGAAACGLLLGLFICEGARAEVHVSIDKSAQRMTVAVDGKVQHVWPVSTGRTGFGTPNGKFRAQWLARKHFSRKYYNSPMPHSVFFHEGYAIHGTEYIRRLGGPASHGCVRLHPGNAKTLYELVKDHGTRNTHIEVTGSSPVVAVSSEAKKRSARAKLRERREARAKSRWTERRSERRSERRWERRWSYRSRAYYEDRPVYVPASAYARWYYGSRYSRY